MAMLIHHGERNNMANSEFSDILYFMGASRLAAVRSRCGAQV
jgi:hypothetical protein